MAYVYRHIRLDKNEPFYIGIGFGKNNRAYEKTKRSVFWKNIISRTEYRVEFLFENVSKDFAIEKEKEFILLYGRKDLGTGTLVNLTVGGENPPTMIGDKNPMKNIENRIKVSNSRIGIKFTNDHKLKLSLSKKLTGIIPPSRKGVKRDPDEVKRTFDKIVESGTWKKPIFQFDLDMNLVKLWRCVDDIKLQNPKYSKGNISMVCRDERSKAYNYYWVYMYLNTIKENVRFSMIEEKIRKII